MNKNIGIMGIIALIVGLIAFFTGGSKKKVEAVKEPLTSGSNEAEEAKKDLMRELGKKGGQASAKKRKAKKTKNKIEALEEKK